MDTSTYQAHINRAEIGFLNSIIESYDGFAVVRTFDAKAGIVELWISPDFESVVIDIMQDIADQIGLQDLHKIAHRLSN